MHGKIYHSGPDRKQQVVRGAKDQGAILAARLSATGITTQDKDLLKGLDVKSPVRANNYQKTSVKYALGIVQ